MPYAWTHGQYTPITMMTRSKQKITKWVYLELSRDNVSMVLENGEDNGLGIWMRAMMMFTLLRARTGTATLLTANDRSAVDTWGVVKFTIFKNIVGELVRHSFYLLFLFTLNHRLCINHHTGKQSLTDAETQSFRSHETLTTRSRASGIRTDLTIEWSLKRKNFEQ